MRTYLLKLSVAMFIFLAIVIGFNLFIDPYGLFDSERVVGINEIKPAASTRSRVVKPYLVEHEKYEVLIGGNSRPEMGLDPTHPCLSKIGPTFSMTLPGAGSYAQFRYLQHAMHIHKPKVVLFGVDFMDFIVSPDLKSDPSKWPPYGNGIDKRLSVNADGEKNETSWLQRFSDYRDAVLSLSAFEASFMTVISQNDASASITRDGFNPAQDMGNIVRVEGQYALFAQKLPEIHKSFNRKNWQIWHRGYEWSSEFETLDRALRSAKAFDVKMIVFINPYHGAYLSAISDAGLWPLFNQWKGKVASLVSHYSEAEFYDFAHRNELTSEPMPVKGHDLRPLKWFWEPAHYRKELGDLMLYKIFESKGCEVPSDLKSKITMIGVSSPQRNHLEN